MSVSDQLLRAVSEKAFQQQVIDLAQLCRWHLLHIDTPARRCPVCKTPVPHRRVAGLPDLLMVRGATLVALELKSETGRATPDQEQVLTWLRSVEAVEARLARPRDWDEIQELLKP